MIEFSKYSTIEQVSKIVKISLQEYHGNRFDDTIDKITIVRNDFRGMPCYYNPDAKGNHNIVISIGQYNHPEEIDSIDINTNLIQIRWFFNTYGREFNHFSDSVTEYNMEFNLKTMYNSSLSSVLSNIRNNRLEDIGI